MMFTEKLRRATILGGYLPGATHSLAAELESRNWTDLLGDEEFERLVLDRAYPCADCGLWMQRKELDLKNPDPKRNPPRCMVCRHRVIPRRLLA